MRFAPLIRVSTEKQAKKGESLRTQRTQLENAISSLEGQVSHWYAGQEHATPEQERRILGQLIEDAIEGKFDAVIVADISRWSRDNRKNKEHLEILKKHKIRFFAGTREFNLYEPQQCFMLSMAVEMHEFFAREQSYKSTINRIERAKRGFPACGKLPYGRLFDKGTGQWSVDGEKKRKIEEIARLYLEEDVSLEALGKRFGMNPTNLHKVLTRRCGSTWVQRFVKSDCGINVSVDTTIPALLPETIIQKIRAKCEARRTWDHGSIKHLYLLGRMIFDMETGGALTGTPSPKGQRYYRTYKGSVRSYMVNADLLEQALTEALFEALATNHSLYAAVFEGSSPEGLTERLAKEKQACETELKDIAQRYAHHRRAIATCQAEGVDGFVASILPDLKELEKRRTEVTYRRDVIQNELQSLPTAREIEDVRTSMRAQLIRSYFCSGLSFEYLPFAAKRRIISLLFGGKDPYGRKYGIYVKAEPGRPKKYRFEAYGRLGNIEGWIEGRAGQYSSGVHPEMYAKTDKDLNTEIARVVVDNDYQLVRGGLEHKAHVHCECHAHHRICLYQ